MSFVHRYAAFLTLAFCAWPDAARAQNESVIVEAEFGVIGSQFSVAMDATVSPPVQYVTIQSTVGGQNPGTADRVITFSVTFPRGGVYELYGRVFVVANDPFNNDSFYYANGFGTKIPNADTNWITSNGLANPVGYTLATDKVVGGGPGDVWRLEVGQALGVRRRRATRRRVQRSRRGAHSDV